MTPQDILLIRKQLWLLQGREEAFAADFYARLFEIAPEIRALFHHDLAEQGRKLMMALTYALGALDQPEVLGPALHRLGARHAAYGVRPEHFEPVGAALLHTLAKWLAGVFDDRSWQAWTAAITHMAERMAKGLEEVRTPFAAE